MGKSGMTDKEGRGAMHYAVAYDQDAAVATLLENKFDLTATDAQARQTHLFHWLHLPFTPRCHPSPQTLLSPLPCFATLQGNTCMHFACGYARVQFIKPLLAAGAPGGARNAAGQSPLDIILAEPRNPLNGQSALEIRELLKAAE